MSLNRHRTLAYSRKSISALLSGYAEVAAVPELEKDDGCLRAIRDTEASVDLGEMELDRVDSELQPPRCLSIGQAGRYELKDLELTRGKRGRIASLSGTCSFIEHEFHRKRDASARLRPLGQRFRAHGLADGLASGLHRSNRGDPTRARSPEYRFDLGS
jgi:hypothetical protein